MDLTQLAIPAFLGLVVLEVVVCAFQGRRAHDSRDTAASLALGVGSVVVGLAWKGVVLATYTALHRLSPFELGSGAGVLALALLADDFAYYWFHRLHHEMRVFWAAHVTHHSSRRYNLSTALRQSWTPMTSLLFYAPLPLLGFEPLLLLTVHSVNLLYQFWIHTETIGRLGPLEWVLNTPSHHRVHHASNAEYLDRNYAGILMVWDRLFGTFEPERAAPRYGLTHDVESHNPVVLAFHEWAALARDTWRAASWRERLGVLLQPPGWRMDGTGTTAPQLRAAASLRSEAAATPGSGWAPADAQIA